MSTFSGLFQFWAIFLLFIKYFYKKVRVRACAYQEAVRNASFSENFAYVLSEWPQILYPQKHENQKFLIYSGGTEKELWLGMS